MNNIFNRQRFIWLFSKYTKEHYKRHLMSIVVLSGILAMTLGYISFFNALDLDAQTTIFKIGLAACGVMFTSSIFSEFGHQQKVISALTLPVSVLERFLVAWIYSFVIFQLVYIACFFAVNTVAFSFDYNHSMYYKEHNFSLTGRIYINSLLYYCFFHAIAFLGALLFKKAHFIKIAFIVLLFFLVLFLINKVLIAYIFNTSVYSGLPFSEITITETYKGNYYLNERPLANTILTILSLLTAACFWTATYLKLKEKQA